MDDLVETLAIGLIVSLILIVVSWWFWKRYDRPSEAQLEREESIAKKKEETRMWRAVEAQMEQEKAALEEKALYERRKAEERARAMPPPSSEVSDAFAAFSTERQAKPSFEQSESAPSAEAALAEPMLEISDDDVLDIDAQIEVRQDQGVILEEGQALPDIFTVFVASVEKLHHTFPTTFSVVCTKHNFPTSSSTRHLIGIKFITLLAN